MKKTAISRGPARTLPVKRETIKLLAALEPNELRRVAGGGSLDSDCIDIICPPVAP